MLLGPKSTFIGIKSLTSNNKVLWYVHASKFRKGPYDSERDAAIAYDKYLISKGKSPVNILKAKNVQVQDQSL